MGARNSRRFQHNWERPIKSHHRRSRRAKRLGSFSIFDPQINQVLSAYRDHRSRNSLACDAARRGEAASGLSDQEFIERYGQPPWDQISELLVAFGLPYKAQAPSWRLDENVTLTLQRNLDDAKVVFTALSSGERVLLRFVLSIFRFDPLRVNLSVPKFLLLDEMDASLHPEMARRWLSTIRAELVERRGIKCILTTHSPTTVAVAPED